MELIAQVEYELRFTSIYDQGRGFSFPCNCSGEVYLDQLSERARTNYFYVRHRVGREFLAPQISKVH